MAFHFKSVACKNFEWPTISVSRKLKHEELDSACYKHGETRKILSKHEIDTKNPDTMPNS